MKRRRSDKGNRKNRAVRASDVVSRSRTELIIDGYNLLHVSRFKPRSQDPGELKRCREGLLTMLAGLLPTTRYRRVRVVFDSRDAPARLPAETTWRHLEVQFARDYNSADELIGHLVRQHHAPRQLVVVSADHHVQVLASRRKATVIDSEPWLAAILDDRSKGQSQGQGDQRGRSDTSAGEDKPATGLDPDDQRAFLAAMQQPLPEPDPARVIPPAASPGPRNAGVDTAGGENESRRGNRRSSAGQGRAKPSQPKPPRKHPDHSSLAKAKRKAAKRTRDRDDLPDAAEDDKPVGGGGRLFPPEYLRQIEREFPDA